MLEGINLLQLSSERMRYLGQRQTLINQNIANADTPGYQAKDLTPFASSNALAQTGSTAAPIAMTATNPAHMGFGLSGTTIAHMNRHGANYDEKPDSNTVSVEEQLVKANDVSNGYDLATTAYRKTVSLLKASIGDAS
jgi:flagellar basal-body rod protein FlgB